MAKVFTICMAGNRAYISNEDHSQLRFKRKHAKAMRKMLKHWLRCH